MAQWTRTTKPSNTSREQEKPAKSRGWVARILGLDEKPEHADALDGIDYFFVIYKRRATVIAITGFFTIAGLAAGFLLKPSYTPVVLVAPTADENSAVNAASGALSTLGLLTGKTTGQRKDTALALLEARETLQQFITQRHLLPIFFPDSWDAARKDWKPGVKPPTLEDGYVNLHGMMKIEASESTNLVKIHVTWKDASQAASWANGLVDLVNSKMQKTAIQRSGRMISELYGEFNKPDNQSLRTNIALLIQDQIRTRMMAEANTEYALQVVDPAEPTKNKSSPGKLLLMIGGFLFGLALSVPVAFFMQALQARKIRQGSRF
jgi:uncharacterized protein involved in exopolysaccharide biosynthesis